MKTLPKALFKKSNENIFDVMKKNNITIEDLRPGVIKACENLLDSLCIDWKNDPNSEDTPKRLAKMYLSETLRGRYEAPPEVKTFNTGTNLGQIMFITNLKVESLCSHHHQNIRGKAHIGIIYMKDSPLIGLSKYQRIIDWFCRRPQVQEDLTSQLVEYISSIIKPNGMGITIEADHMCMACRGVEIADSKTVTQQLYGSFINEQELRREYLGFINSLKR